MNLKNSFATSSQLKLFGGPNPAYNPFQLSQKEERALLQLCLVSQRQTSGQHPATCPAQETLEELFHCTPTRCVLLLPPC